MILIKLHLLFMIRPIWLLALGCLIVSVSAAECTDVVKCGITNSKGKDVCCPIGYLPNADRTKCGDSVFLGLSNDLLIECFELKTNDYLVTNAGKTAYIPTTCPADRSCNGVKASLCKVGQYAVAGTGVCLDCPAGHACHDGAAVECNGNNINYHNTTCLPCPTSAVCKNGSFVKCNLGLKEVRRADGVMGCSSCSNDRYNAATKTCKECTENMSCLLGIACASGFYYNDDFATGSNKFEKYMSGCIPCPERNMCSGGVIRPCEKGTYSNGAGASSCLTCEPGTWSPAGASKCTACPENQTSVAPFHECIDIVPLGYSNGDKVGMIIGAITGVLLAGGAVCAVVGILKHKKQSMA